MTQNQVHREIVAGQVWDYFTTVKNFHGNIDERKSGLTFESLSFFKHQHRL